MRKHVHSACKTGTKAELFFLSARELPTGEVGARATKSLVGARSGPFDR